MVKAVARPDEAGDVERVRSMVWESLVEDEILDVQLDKLSPEEFLREVCRKIGRSPPGIPLPQGWDEGEAVDAVLAEAAEATDHEPVEGWPRLSDESGAGRPVPKLSAPDSS